jgi:hypothetical protein
LLLFWVELLLTIDCAFCVIATWQNKTIEAFSHRFLYAQYVCILLVHNYPLSTQVC